MGRYSSVTAFSLSCPSRGTWIEIAKDESGKILRWRSCPSRGTWIEIVAVFLIIMELGVVPLAGHVD